MKQIFAKSGIVFAIFLQSCQPTSGQNNQEHKSGNTNTTKSNTMQSNLKDYTEFSRVKVLDKQGYSTPAEAFSLLIPKGWGSSGEIIWIAPGQHCAGTNMYFRSQSPDGKTAFEILPKFIWSWSADPQVNAFNQQQGNGQYCSTGQPIDASEFLQNVWVRELGNATILDIKVNKDVIATMGKDDNKYKAEMMRYGSSGLEFRHTAVTARVKLPNGKSGILFCRVTNIANQIPNMYNGTTSVSYTSVADRMIYIFPETDKEKSELAMTVVVSSIRTNPVWKETTDKFWRDVREQKHVAHVGTIRIMDETTKQIANRATQKGNERLASMDNQMRSWEARQSTNDKIHNDFIKTIREVENYQDVNGKVELTSGYHHAWSRGDGNSFIMTNSPNFNPASVFQDQNWKEMRKVD